MHYDFVIIGSGIAGLSAALQASKKGRVLIVTKKNLADSNTWLAQGGIAAVFSQSDSFKKHIDDTLKAGCRHNNKKAVEAIIKAAPGAIRRLQLLGANFTKSRTGSLELNLEGGHSSRRIVHSGDFTGKSVEKALIKEVKKNRNICIWENTFAKDLVIKNGTCYGTLLIKDRKLKTVFARRTILATGGLGQIYAHTPNPTIATGDGIAMAYRGGCHLHDLEFIQFHPTAFDEKENPQFLISESIRGEGAILLNARNERFMKRYHPLAELAPRDIVSRAIFEEEKKGQVFLDLRHKGEKFLKKKFPTIFRYLLEHGYNMAKDIIPVTPAAHYSCGGITASIDGKTNIKNLYAIGEVACTGLHGANRLASNSLLEAAVMGNLVAKSSLPSIKKFPSIRQTDKHDKLSIPHIRKMKEKLRQLMWERAGIIRTNKLLSKLEKWLIINGKQIPESTDPDTCELHNMFQTALLIVKAARRRKKSLGCHFMKD